MMPMTARSGATQDQQHRGRGVPGDVQPGVPPAGCLKQPLPLRVIRPRADRRTCRGREDLVPVRPQLRRHQALPLPRPLVLPQQGLRAGRQTHRPVTRPGFGLRGFSGRSATRDGRAARPAKPSVTRIPGRYPNTATQRLALPQPERDRLGQPCRVHTVMDARAGRSRPASMDGTASAPPGRG